MADLVTVDDGNSSIVYSPSSAWRQGGVLQELDGTRHFTLELGAMATFTFNGTLVQVFGTIGPDVDPDMHSVVSTYSVDGSTPTTYTGQPIVEAQYRVQFFKSPTLQSGEHTLVINNTGQHTDFFFLDYIQFLPITTTTSANTTTGLSTTTPPTVLHSPDVASPHSVNISTGAFIGAVIGAVIPFLVIIALLIWCFRRRAINLKRLIESEREKKGIASSPNASDLPGLGSA